MKIRYNVFRFLMLSALMTLQSCWISPNVVLETPGITDDSSVTQIVSYRDDPTFNDFITSVYQATAEEKQALVDSFMQWADSATGIPYLENNTAYFLYLNGSNPSVAVAGDFSDWDPSGQQFSHLTGTNLYFRGFDFEPDARLDYKLVVNGNWILDPLNPHTTSGGYGPNSELAMTDYIQPPEIQNYNFPQGSLMSTSFTDTTKGRTRSVSIYTPPGYVDTELSYRTIYFHDGGEYLRLGSAQNVLDFMIANELIPPVIGIFVDPTNRMEEYAYDIDFMEMFVNELVPWIDDNYRTMPQAQSRAVVGVSLGGLTSLLFTLEHPEVFANCGAYSSAIWFGDLIQNYENSLVLPVKIYMDAGTYEGTIYNSSSALLEVFENNAWDHQWQVWHEGHSWGAWRAHLDESLLYFWPLATTGIDDNY